jgi:hypothetical protein
MYSSSAPTPPYGFSVPIPPHIAAGSYTLTAVAGAGLKWKSKPVTIRVERADRPLAIEIDPPFLDVEVGSESALTVLGDYPDGSQVDLTRSRHTTFASQAPAIARVSPDGFVDAVSVGVTNIVIDGNNLIPVTVRPARR